MNPRSGAEDKEPKGEKYKDELEHECDGRPQIPKRSSDALLANEHATEEKHHGAKRGAFHGPEIAGKRNDN